MVQAYDISPTAIMGKTTPTRHVTQVTDEISRLRMSSIFIRLRLSGRGPSILTSRDGSILGVSFDGMYVQAILGILGLAAATFSTLWATGGWRALRRRSIQQELNLANDLPSSAAKARLTTHVAEEIDIYLYRIHHEQSPQLRLALGIFLLVFAIVAVISKLFQTPYLR